MRQQHTPRLFTFSHTFRFVSVVLQYLPRFMLQS